MSERSRSAEKKLRGRQTAQFSLSKPVTDFIIGFKCRKLLVRRSIVLLVFICKQDGTYHAARSLPVDVASETGVTCRLFLFSIVPESL